MRAREGEGRSPPLCGFVPRWSSVNVLAWLRKRLRRVVVGGAIEIGEARRGVEEAHLDAAAVRAILRHLGISDAPLPVARSRGAPRHQDLAESEGDEVKEVDGVIVVEAMNMENELRSPKAGKVTMRARRDRARRPCGPRHVRRCARSAVTSLAAPR